MQPIMEYKGSDIDEAVNNACLALGVRREELEIEVVSTGSAGIFGLGRKKAMVRVALRGKGRGREEALVTPAAPVKPTIISDKREARDEDEVRGEPLTATEQAEIRELVTRLLALAGLPLTVTVTQDGGNHKVRVELSGPDQELLIGPEGQTLDAIQYLIRKIIGKQSAKKIVLELDAGGFRRNRQQDLESRALALAAEVKATGHSRTVPAINPAERRIIHLALQADPDIRSRSVGEGVFKKVLIHLPGKGRKNPPRRRSGGRSGGAADRNPRRDSQP